MAASGTQGCCWLGGTPGVSGVSADPPASLIGAFAYDVTALCLGRLFPDPLDPLAGPRAGSSMPFPVLTTPQKDGCEVSFIPWSHVSTTLLLCSV